MCIQVLYESESVNANEIANGVLSSLVAITAGCAFVDYWGACLIGGKIILRVSLAKIEFLFFYFYA